MKAITICQPFASAIISGIKRVENRMWGCEYRGPLIIHAGLSKSWFDEAESLGSLALDKLKPFEELPRGKLLGVVDLVEVVCFAEVEEPVGYEWLKDDPFAFGPYCWILENPRLLVSPVKFKGHQSLFEVPDEILKMKGVETMGKEKKKDLAPRRKGAKGKGKKDVEDEEKITLSSGGSSATITAKQLEDLAQGGPRTLKEAEKVLKAVLGAKDGLQMALDKNMDRMMKLQDENKLLVEKKAILDPVFDREITRLEGLCSKLGLV